jgi:hypothetical protein
LTFWHWLWPFQPSASHRCAPALEDRNMKYVLQFVKAMAQLTVNIFNSIQCNPILQINFKDFEAGAQQTRHIMIHSLLRQSAFIFRCDSALIAFSFAVTVR